MYNENYSVSIYYTVPNKTNYILTYTDNNVNEMNLTSLYVDKYVSGYAPEFSLQTNQMNMNHLNKMLSCLVEQIDTQFRDIGVSAYDLGFESYK